MALLTGIIRIALEPAGKKEEFYSYQKEYQPKRYGNHAITSSALFIAGCLCSRSCTCFYHTIEYNVCISKRKGIMVGFSDSIPVPDRQARE